MSAAASAGPSGQEGERLEELRMEARYRRDRLALYRARVYGGGALSVSRLRELEMASDGAAARLERAERH